MNTEELLALPVAVDLPTAGRVLGLSKNTSYRLARDGTFPLRLIRAGRQYRVPRAEILKAFGITDPGLALAATADPNAASPLPTASDH